MTATLIVMTLLASAPDSWVLVRDGRSSSMHGDMADLAAARRHLKELGPGYLWFRHEGREYVVRDGKAIEQIEEVVQPQEELGSEQGRLGRKQAELGRQQGELGRRQARADGDEQRELSRAQEALGREQEKIGHEQEKLGKQQEKLGRELQRKVEQVIEASLKDGTAKRID